MEKIQSLAFWKKPAFILALILAAFFVKGVFLTAIFPLFDGQDEARHYNTIQFLNEPKNAIAEDEKDQRANDYSTRDKDDFNTYNFSEEIQKISTAVNINILRGEIYNTQVFSQSFDGQNENAINSKEWKPYNYYSHPDIASEGSSLYHKIVSLIEKVFNDQSILVRFYLIRIFSVALGAFVVFLSYLITKNIGFSAKHSLLLAATVSFQPKFSMYSTNINYDALFIPLFVFFTYGCILIIKNNLNWKNLLIVALSVYLGILTKQTAFVMLAAAVFLFAYLAYEKIKNKDKKTKRIFIYASIAGAILLLLCFKTYFIGSLGSFGSFFGSIGEYLSKSLTIGRFSLSSRTYWGTLGWVNNWFLMNATTIIWIIQTFAAAGIAFFLFSKKEKPKFLPEKKYVVFLLLMVALLQIGIRFADWSLFRNLGYLETGAPGRYFLPNIVSHIILVFVGLGTLIERISTKFGKSDSAKKYFEYSLVAGLILMMTFMFYLIFDTIIFRYYL